VSENKYKNENILQPSTLNKQHKYQIFIMRREIARYEKLHNKEKKNDLRQMQWWVGRRLIKFQTYFHEAPRL